MVLPKKLPANQSTGCLEVNPLLVVHHNTAKNIAPKQKPTTVIAANAKMSFIFFSDCVSTSLADSDIFFSDPMPSVGTTQAKAGNEQGKGPRVATGIMVVYPHAKCGTS